MFRLRGAPSPTTDPTALDKPRVTIAERAVGGRQNKRKKEAEGREEEEQEEEEEEEEKGLWVH